MITEGKIPQKKTCEQCGAVLARFAKECGCGFKFAIANPTANGWNYYHDESRPYIERHNAIKADVTKVCVITQDGRGKWEDRCSYVNMPSSLPCKLMGVFKASSLCWWHDKVLNHGITPRFGDFSGLMAIKRAGCGDRFYDARMESADAVVWGLISGEPEQPEQPEQSEQSEVQLQDGRCAVCGKGMSDSQLVCAVCGWEWVPSET